jgi:hypothetical protein
VVFFTRFFYIFVFFLSSCPMFSFLRRALTANDLLKFFAEYQKGTEVTLEQCQELIKRFAPLSDTLPIADVCEIRSFIRSVS